MRRIEYKDRTVAKAFKSAELIASEGLAIREAAKRLGYSKSAVFYYIYFPVKDLFPELYSRVVEILKINAEEATKRGGQSTSLKYKYLRENFNFERR